MAEQTTPHGSDIELLINLTKDVAVLSEAFKSFKAERSADNDSLKEEMREMKADMKEMKSDIIALKAEPGKQAKTRQDKVIDLCSAWNPWVHRCLTYNLCNSYFRR